MSFRGVHLSFRQTWSTKSHKRRMTLHFDQTYVLSMEKTSRWASLLLFFFFFEFPPDLIDIPNAWKCAQNTLLWKHTSVEGLLGIENAEQMHFNSEVSSHQMCQPDNFYMAWSEPNVTDCESAFSWQEGVKAKKASPPSLVHVRPCLL